MQFTSIKKTNYIGLILGLLLLLFSCEEKVFNLVLNIDDTYEFDVFDDGIFTEIEVITLSDFIDNVDIDDDAEVDDVNLESLAIKITQLNGNEAEAVRVNGYIYLGDLSQTPIPVFENMIVEREDFTQLQAITQFKEEGILAFNNKMKGFVENTDNESFTFVLTGVSIPDGGRISVKVDLRMRATVKFKQTLETPFFIGDE